MKGHGGFEHNRHSLRIVEELEQKYPDFPGPESVLGSPRRSGQALHRLTIIPSKRKGFDAKNSSLEAQIANLADEITYYSHDLDDGLDSGLLSEKKLDARRPHLGAGAAQLVKKEYGALPDECRRYFIIRTIIDMQVKDVVETSEQMILKARRARAPMTCGCIPNALVQYSPDAARTEPGIAQLSLQKSVLQSRRA